MPPIKAVEFNLSQAPTH